MSVKSCYFACFVLFHEFFCTGHFVMVPLNLTCLHCLQHFIFEHLFNLYYHQMLQTFIGTTRAPFRQKELQNF